MAEAAQRIGEYVLEAKVGGGTFGEVWRAHHHVWVDQLVAIKIPTDPQYLRNLQREGVAIHGLVHPNIVRAIGFDPYAATPYLTMEYIPGSSLRPLIQSRSLAIDNAVLILKQILLGLKYAHDQKVIHRDIKPENILVHERAFRDGFGVEGVVKITDFGLGKAATTAAGSIAFSASMNDPAGRDIAGTLDYMSPEQRSGAGVDQRSDLYACGVILYEMLTGERPAGTDLPSEMNREVPRQLDDIFRRSYARLDKRFANAHEFLAALAPTLPPPLPADLRSRTHREVGGGMPPLPPAIPGGAVGAGVGSSRSSCPQCRQMIEANDQFCMHCGVQLVAHVRRCGKCGAYPDVVDKYCIFCGETLKPQAAMA